MRTLFLNPPSFEGFDGGAGSRWPSTREIESYWYPVWLCYPAGMLEDSKVLDAPPHKISIEQTVEQGKNFELLVLYTSSPGFHVDVKIAEVMKVYKRDLDFHNYNVPFLLNPYISMYTSRGCPAMCTFCLWPQTHSGHRWRLRSTESVVGEVRYVLENFPGLKEIFFDDDTFN